MSLPLKAKLAVRDSWDNADAPAKQALNEVAKVLGYDIRCEPDWAVLIAQLGNTYPDKGALVIAVAGCVEMWCKALNEILEDEASEEFVGKLLEKGEESWKRINLSIGVTKEDTPSTNWSANTIGYDLCIPNSEPIISPANHYARFKSQIFSAFEEQPSLDQITESQTIAATTATVDDWTDVVVAPVSNRSAPPPAQTPATRKSSGNAQLKPQIDILADATTLPRPDELLLQPPYHLSVTARSRTEVEIQCSHSPTLEFLSTYLKKWCRTNMQNTNKPPLVEIVLHASPFGLGIIYDSLVIESTNRYGAVNVVTPMAVLNLVESILGYERIWSTAGAWHFRKDGPLKKKS